MLAEQKRKTNIGVGIGILLQIAGQVIRWRIPGEAGDGVGTLLLIAGLGFLLWGCRRYATAKGYHAAWGGLGMLSIIGLIVLVFMPDKNKGEPRPEPADTTETSAA